MLPACAAIAALGAWWLHRSIVQPDPSNPGAIWLALAILLMFGVFTVMLPVRLLANDRTRRPARALVRWKGPQPLTINIAKGSLIYSFGFFGPFFAGMLASVGGFEGVGTKTSEIFLFGLLLAAVSAFILATSALKRWSTRGRSWQIRIDADGIGDSQLGSFLVSWSDVTAIRRLASRHHAFVAFDLRDAAAYRKSLRPMDRLWTRLSGKLRGRTYMLGLNALNIAEGEFVDALRTFKPPGVVMVGFPEARV